jgi:hypothetical protein
MVQAVTDPELLKQLEGDSGGAVSDPELLAQLEGKTPAVKTAASKRDATHPLMRAVYGVTDPAFHAVNILDRGIVNPVRQKLFPGASSMQDVIREREASYQAPEGMDWWRLGGNALTAWMPQERALAATEAIPRIAAAAPWKRAVASNAAVGGTQAGITSAGTGGSMSDVAGATGAGTLFGGVLGGGAHAASNTLKWGYDALKDANGEKAAAKWLNEKVFGNRADAAVQALRNTKPIVPGEQVTAGLAATPSLPELKTLQRTAEKAPETGHKFTQIDANNQKARIAPLVEMAYPSNRYFDPATGKKMLSEAEQLRSDVTGPLFKRAGADRVDSTPQIENILAGGEMGPSTRFADRSIDQSSANSGGATTRGTYAVEPTFSTPMQGETPVMTSLGAPSTHSIDELQRVRMALDDEMDQLRRGGTNKSGLSLRQLAEARNQVSEHMRQGSGNFALASDTFANLSQPQNQGVVANSLVKALKSPSGLERNEKYLAAVEKPPAELARKDLSPRFQDIREIMTPDQMGTINKVTRSVKREQDVENLANVDVEQFQSAMGKVERAVPAVLNTMVSTARRFARLGGKSSEDKVRAIVNEATTDPNKLADLMQYIPPSERNAFLREINMIGQPVRNISMTAATAAGPQENQNAP